jgi:branched-subunit amino acid transport protein AzlD
LEREKPINLFLTLKKVVFENLKNAAENFSNQLLNKHFGNEDVEEESQQDYQSNIQPTDINIAKFKADNEYNSSIKKGFYYMRIIIIILFFLVFNFIYLIFKYCDFRNRMENTNQFISLYDKTFSAQIDLILSINIFKSFLFNKTIPMLKKNKNDNTVISIDMIFHLLI